MKRSKSKELPVTEIQAATVVPAKYEAVVYHDELIAALVETGRLSKDAEVESLYFVVPTGGDWSGTVLGIDNAPVHVEFKLKGKQ